MYTRSSRFTVAFKAVKAIAIWSVRYRCGIFNSTRDRLLYLKRSCVRYDNKDISYRYKILSIRRYYQSTDVACRSLDDCSSALCSAIALPVDTVREISIVRLVFRRVGDRKEVEVVEKCLRERNHDLVRPDDSAETFVHPRDATMRASLVVIFADSSKVSSHRRIFPVARIERRVTEYVRVEMNSSPLSFFYELDRRDCFTVHFPRNTTPRSRIREIEAHRMNERVCAYDEPEHNTWVRIITL